MPEDMKNTSHSAKYTPLLILKSQVTERADNIELCSFEGIDRDLWPQIINIEVEPEQRQFVDASINSLEDYIFMGAQDDPVFDLYAIKIDTKVVGVFTLSITDRQYLWLGGLQVDASFQRRGIAKKTLLTLYRRVIKDTSYSGIQLNVHIENICAIELYRSLGMYTLEACSSVDSEHVIEMEISRKQIEEYLCSSRYAKIW